MKTKFALAFYYVAIGSLVITAGGIVWKLIIFPPCTPTGNTCTVDPGTVAGLAGTVLAVAATVLAILGAVAVAAWWTSLDDRVTKQVETLYEEQSAHASAQVNTLLHTLEVRVNDQLQQFQGTFDQLRSETTKLQGKVDSMNTAIEGSIRLHEETIKLNGRIVDALVGRQQGVSGPTSSQVSPKEAPTPDKNNSTNRKS